MLLESGPIAGIDVDLWTRPGPRTNLEADAAQLAGQLATAQSTIATRQATMASDTSAAAVVAVGPDMDDQLAELARQSGAFDSSIGGVAAGADAQASAIGGFANDAAQSIADAVAPQAPSRGQWKKYPDDDGGGGGGGGVGGGGWPKDATNFLTAEFAKFYRRNVFPDEWDLWLPTWPDTDTIERAILASDEYAADVNKLYRDYFGRGVQDDELADARNNRWGLAAVEANLQSRS